MPRVGNKHYPYTPEGRAAAARDKQGRGLTATEGFNQPGQLDDAAGRAMMKKGGKVKGFKGGGESKMPKEVKESKKIGKARSLREAVFGQLFEKKKKVKNKEAVAKLKDGGLAQGYNARLDESLGERHGKNREQGKTDRRDESKAMSKKDTGHAYAGMKKGGKVTANKSSGRSKASKRADGIARQGHTKGRVV